MACEGKARKKSIDVLEVGIPGMRLVPLDGTSVMTNADGRFSVCVAVAQTQFIRVDRSTPPKETHLVPTSSRNAGMGYSFFIDSQSPSLRADFVEGSCSAEMMDQVSAR